MEWEGGGEREAERGEERGEVGRNTGAAYVLIRPFLAQDFLCW